MYLLTIVMATRISLRNCSLIPSSALRSLRISFKASFFRSLGYYSSDWNRLAGDLRDLAVSGDAVLAESTRYGKKYTVAGILVGPSGVQASVVSVWIVVADDPVPRLVTAYPGVER